MNYLIHPGFPKTATTTIQNNVFAQCEDIMNLARPYTEQSMAIAVNLKKVEGVNYDEASTQALITKMVSDARDSRKNTIILSDEILSTNGYMKIEIAKRIKNLFQKQKFYLLFVINLMLLYQCISKVVQYYVMYQNHTKVNTSSLRVIWNV